jgi:hypothetical protein
MIDCPSDGLDWTVRLARSASGKLTSKIASGGEDNSENKDSNRFLARYRSETRITANKNVSNQQPFR